MIPTLCTFPICPPVECRKLQLKTSLIPTFDRLIHILHPNVPYTSTCKNDYHQIVAPIILTSETTTPTTTTTTTIKTFISLRHGTLKQSRLIVVVVVIIVIRTAVEADDDGLVGWLVDGWVGWKGWKDASSLIWSKQIHRHDHHPGRRRRRWHPRWLDIAVTHTIISCLGAIIILRASFD